MFLAIAMALSLFVGAIPAMAADVTPYVVSNFAELTAAMEDAKASGAPQTIKFAADITLESTITIESNVTWIADSPVIVNVGRNTINIGNDQVFTIRENITIYQPDPGLANIYMLDCKFNATLNLFGCTVHSDTTARVDMITAHKIQQVSGARINIKDAFLYMPQCDGGRAVYIGLAPDNMVTVEDTLILINNGATIYTSTFTLRGSTQLIGTTVTTPKATIYDYRFVSVHADPVPEVYEAGDLLILTVKGTEGPAHGDSVMATVLDSKILYTTDGTDPTTSSTAIIYTMPIPLSEGMVVKAVPTKEAEYGTVYGSIDTYEYGEPNEAVSGNIVSVSTIAGIRANYGTSADALVLPSAVMVTLDGGTTKAFAINWNIATFNPNQAGRQTITGDLVYQSTVTNTSNLKASIVVNVLPEDLTTLIPRQVNAHFGDDASSAMNITYTTMADIESKIVYSEAGQSEKITAIGTPVIGTGSDKYFHTFNLAGLTPGTVYEYVVGEDGFTYRGTFKTAPPQGSVDKFSFAYLADTQVSNATDAQSLGETLQEVADGKYDFTYIAGDLTDGATSQSESQWELLFNNTGKFPNGGQNLFGRTSLSVVQGERDSDTFAGHINAPATAGNNAGKAVYSYDYGPATFIMLNLEAANIVSARDAQRSYLTTVVNEAKSRGQWTIVGFHKSIYSGASNIIDVDVINARNFWGPVLADLDVDMVLQGHADVYFRGFINADGTNAISDADAASGKTVQKPANAPLYMVAGNGGYVELEVSFNEITLKAYTTSKTLHDSLTVKRVSELVKVENIELDHILTSVEIGVPKTLTAIITPAQATSKNVLWKSSDTTIAIVNASGVITGLKSGTAIITATSIEGRKTASCTVVVTEACPKVSTATGGITKITTSVYDDPSAMMGFTWYAGRRSVNSYVIIDEVKSNVENATNANGTLNASANVQHNINNVTKPGQVSLSVSYNATIFAGTDSSPGGKYANDTNIYSEYLHKVVVTGLQPGKTYYYKIGDPDANLWSEVGSFKTAPTSGAFTFIDTADSQTKEYDEFLLAIDTLNKAVETVPDAAFIAVNGDLVDVGADEAEWDLLFNDAANIYLNTVMVPAGGNHEAQTNSFIDHFNVKPADGSKTTTAAYYSFDYSNAHFVILNTSEPDGRIADNFSDDQINWMKADITDAKSRGMDWVIVLMHKGPYTTSNHATDEDLWLNATSTRKVVAPLFAQLDVDMVLQGHDHIYARSKPIDENNEATASTTITELFQGQQMTYQVNPDGVIYVIPGTSGPKVYYKNNDRDRNGDLIVGNDYYDKFDWAEENRAAVYGPAAGDSSRPERSLIQNFMAITIDGDTLSAITYEIDRGGYYSPNDTPYIIDTFGIVKNDALIGDADKTALAAKLAEAKAINKDEYTAESYADLDNAIKEGEAIIAKIDATQSEVNKAVLDLSNAIAALEKISANKAVLTAKLAEAKAINRTEYTAISYAVLDNAIKAGEAVMTKDNATQSEVNKAVLDLSNAIATLVKTGTDPDVKLSLKLNTQALDAGQDLTVETSFNNQVDSNVAKLMYTFSDELFEYKRFVTASGVTVLNEEITAGKAVITVMVIGYDTKTYGNLELTAKKNVDVVFTVSLSNELVVKAEDGSKESVTYTVSVTSDPCGGGDGRIPGDFNGDGKVDILDLSDMIDAFGITSSHLEWATIYRYMDFNQNGEVDIQDIVLLTRHIFNLSIELPQIGDGLTGSANHIKDNGSITTPATCTAEGVMTFKCERCGKIIGTESIAKLAHDWEAVDVIASTETTSGYTVYKCRLCGEEKEDDFTPPVTANITDAEFLQERAAGIIKNGLSQNNLHFDGKILTLVIDGREFVLSTNANNRNIDGQISLGDGCYLVFDIKGNGSNIKVFEVIKK